MDTETINQTASLLQEAFGSASANELLQHQLQFFSKSIHFPFLYSKFWLYCTSEKLLQTPKANVQSSHATEVSQLKYKEALAKVEQLEFENALLKQKLKEWEQ